MNRFPCFDRFNFYEKFLDSSAWVRTFENVVLKVGKRFLLSFLLAISTSGQVAFGQSDAKVLLANLKQDLEMVTREVSGLRTEVESLRRENAQLRMAVDQSQRASAHPSAGASALVLELQNRVQSLDLAFKQSERARNLMQEEINGKFKEIVEQMNKGFGQLAELKSGPSTPAEPSFSSNYPKNGFVHKVEKGETVSSIAQKYKSKIDWIINANSISDPTKVFVGRELFVPQK